ncbi:MAG: TIGR02587 family membrane protein [Pseudohongiella sp.]
MTTPLDSSASDPDPTLKQWLGVGRAFGGAVIFSLPLMMTMEMWWLGFYIDPLRLLCLLLLSFPLLVGVSSVIGFTDSRALVDNVIDVFVAYAFGFLVSGLTLFLFNTLNVDQAAGISFSTIMLQTIPASLGALLGRSELGSGEHDRTDEKGRGDELVVLAVGALFLALNVAPTEEIPMIAYQMSPWHLLGLFIITVLVMHVFVIAGSYSEGKRSEGVTGTVTGYVYYTCLALLVGVSISVLMLWIFGRSDGLSFTALLANTLVLLFPAGIGAAAARLII